MRAARTAAALVLALAAGARPAAAGGRPARAAPAGLDADLERELDVDGDGAPDTIRLRVRAETIRTPARWTLEIRSKGRLLLRREADDAAVDALFAQAPGGCAGYEACKAKHYLVDLLASSFLVVRPRWPLPFPEAAGRACAARYLAAERGLAKAEAERIAAAAVRRLAEKGGVLVQIVRSPIAQEEALLFVPEVQGFVPVTEPGGASP